LKKFVVAESTQFILLFKLSKCS